MLDRLVRELRVLADEKKLSLQYGVEDAETEVVFDEYCLTNSVTNLIQNAIKFTERGGIFVKLYRDAKTDLYLEIRDTGIGIDSSFLPRLFEPFSQESYDTARRFEGAGLGLALVKRYLDLHGAQIEVQSDKGAGSTFRIRFLNDQTAVTV